MQVPIINLSGYLFVSLPETTLPQLKENLLSHARKLSLKGTILLSTEGINAFLAGTRLAVDEYVSMLQTIPEFSTLTFKESITDYQPFNRMLVRIKKEIIPMSITAVNPEKKTAPHLAPETLREWYQAGRDMIVLDTRNRYEVELGTFENATDLGLNHFRDFVEAIDYLPEGMREKTIVTFCTGGIRCEKAAELMLQKGFQNVYQLDGGILKYFEKCGGDFYRGECFVFDQRVSVDSNLKETKTKQCFDCRTPLPAHAVVNARCPQCGSKSISKSGDCV